VAELARRSSDCPAIDVGYAAVSVTDAPLDVLSSDPPHLAEGPWWPLRIVHADGSEHDDAIQAATEAQAMESAWWNWPGSKRIERADDGPATRVTGREVAGGAVTQLFGGSGVLLFGQTGSGKCRGIAVDESPGGPTGDSTDTDDRTTGGAS
jgi:hypothetical protein